MGSGRRTNNERKSKKRSSGTKILVIILILVILIAGVLLGIKLLNKKTEEPVNSDTSLEQKEPEKQLKTVDVNSKSRPYAVMINNNHAAWPQCGIQDAYLVYEIIAEGGITRMMAIYKDAETAKIGSVRSARHYFIDYAEENDAIFVHWGGSDLAYSRIYTGINDIDGIALEGSVFFRDRTLNRDLEHTGFTKMESLVEYANEKGYTRDSNKDLLLNYSIDEIDSSTLEGAQIANSIDIKYSDYHKTSYEYDAENKVYKRSMSDKANVDLSTGEQYTAKNIIVYKINNYSVDSYGRQDLNNIGSGSGYYITDGYAIPITWSKSSHSSQTVYEYANGEEITVNDGNTFIQICPTSGNITIE